MHDSNRIAIVSFLADRTVTHDRLLASYWVFPSVCDGCPLWC